jgi:hypothetical protein
MITLANLITTLRDETAIAVSASVSTTSAVAPIADGVAITGENAGSFAKYCIDHFDQRPPFRQNFVHIKPRFIKAFEARIHALHKQGEVVFFLDAVDAYLVFADVAASYFVYGNEGLPTVALTPFAYVDGDHPVEFWTRRALVNAYDPDDPYQDTPAPEAPFHYKNAIDENAVDQLLADVANTSASIPAHIDKLLVVAATSDGGDSDAYYLGPDIHWRHEAPPMSKRDSALIGAIFNAHRPHGEDGRCYSNPWRASGYKIDAKDHIITLRRQPTSASLRLARTLGADAQARAAQARLTAFLTASGADPALLALVVDPTPAVSN